MSAGAVVREAAGHRVVELRGVVRTVDHVIPPGVWPDMTTQGYERDDLAGQWSYYGKVGGVVTTGNEDGGKHVSAQVLYALQHIGLTIPPQSDAYWNGEAGPGDSYCDPGSGGPENAWTTRNTVFMTWNILHFARMLKDAGGVPVYGNSTHDWDLSQPDHPNPEYR
jgi:multimeric flavodoxin WrbA